MFFLLSARARGKNILAREYDSCKGIPFLLTISDKIRLVRDYEQE
jgi:hypothetical protein